MQSTELILLRHIALLVLQLDLRRDEKTMEKAEMQKLQEETEMR